MAFNIGRHKGPGGPVATLPKNGLTMTEFLILVGQSHLTMDEAKIVAWRIIKRSKEWQEGAKRTDARFYRTETRAEAEDLKVTP
jgi:hypothetical protein